ncbi:hypothetical protein QUB80_02065 [Chlorogloeopsis sp. ULAP01]|nr:hypothetical protein [Chlorogloeopsis sp. ULAP01]MDM9379486.1 hypothetical protein [Chlorogloeopsis sp. ULAP01]
MELLTPFFHNCKNALPNFTETFRFVKERILSCDRIQLQPALF